MGEPAPRSPTASKSALRKNVENINEPELSPADEPAAAEIVDVRFRVAGRATTFHLGTLECDRNAAVVVETDRGPELGEVIGAPRARFAREEGAKLPRVIRVASTEDLARAEHNRGQEASGRDIFNELAAGLRLPLKLLQVDYRFDGGKAAFYFMSTKGKVEHRGLARDLSQRLHMRVEMRQIGDRDEAKLIGAMGPCGRELCCSSWMREFAPVSIKHAKEQGLSLNPEKLSGMCGRLKCCLRYEYDTYAGLRRGLPRVGKKVSTIHGEGVVIQQAILKRQVAVRRFEDEVVVDCSLEDLVERKPGDREEPRTQGAGADIAPPLPATIAPPEEEAAPEISEWEAASTPDPKSRRKRARDTENTQGGRKRRRRPRRRRKPKGSDDKTP